MSSVGDRKIPVLTDVVAESEANADEADQLGGTIDLGDIETLIAELQTRIASQTFTLADDLMREAFAEMEANIFRQISSRLRQELPEMIDSIIRVQLTGNQED